MDLPDKDIQFKITTILIIITMQEGTVKFLTRPKASDLYLSQTEAVIYSYILQD